ncbi:hypothetical protein [Actinoplanes sp. NPDC026623]|uniref:hypothetical protein n=1 Tax=Actinoplanes sp. NPDC026623 TaxID=3155610 RepID=UPI0033F4FABA
MDLNFETIQLSADPGLSMTLLSAPAGSAADDALRLAGWFAARLLPVWPFGR